MRQNKKNANALRNEKNGNITLTELLTKQHINYDRVEGLLLANPQLISNLRCSMVGNGLTYEAPCGLHRDIQSCNLRAVSIICLALSDEDFTKLSTKISRRKKEYLKDVRTRFQSAQMSVAYA